MQKVNEEALLQRFSTLIGKRNEAERKAMRDAEEFGAKKNYPADTIQKLSAFLFAETENEDERKELDYLNRYVEEVSDASEETAETVERETSDSIVAEAESVETVTSDEKNYYLGEV